MKRTKYSKQQIIVLLKEVELDANPAELQPAGRALVGLPNPAMRQRGFFGLQGLAVKFSSILTYVTVSWAAECAHRPNISVTASYFVAGLAILTEVDVR